MKNTMMVILMLTVFGAFKFPFAYGSVKTLSVRDSMKEHEDTKKSLNAELDKIRTYMISEGEKYEYDFSLMDQNTLSQFIKYQKRYLTIKKSFVDDLARIYFEDQMNHFDRTGYDIDKNQNQDFETRYKKSCNILQRIAGTCEKNSKFYVHEAQDLNQRIQKIEMLESSLNYAIVGQIIDEDKAAVDLSHSRNTLKLN